MLVLVTYDIGTTDASGRARLRKIANRCVSCGQRVQSSVFECKLDPGQLKKLQSDLRKLMDPTCDSVRFYNLGNNYRTRIEHFGAKVSYMPDDALIL